jgi:hypothetical protein
MSKVCRRLLVLVLVAATAALVVSCVDPVRLRFSGSADELTDPFTLPSGPYRVHLRTDGYASVRAIHVADPEVYEYLFIISEGEATEGISAMCVSDGQRIMLEFSVITAPYELWFEEIR